MSSHMRGRGRGGGFRGSSSFRGRGTRPPRGRGSFSDRNRDSYFHQSMGGERSNSSHSHSKPREFIPNMGSRNHFDLSKALVDSVLKGSESDRRGSYSDGKSSSYAPKKHRPEGRGHHMRDEFDGRDGRPSSDRPLSSKYHRYKDDGGYDQYERSKPPHDMGRPKYDSTDKYSRGEIHRKRPLHFEQSYPPFKKPRHDGMSDTHSSRGRPFKPFIKKDYKEMHMPPGRTRDHYVDSIPPRPMSSKKYIEGGRRSYDDPPPRRPISESRSKMFSEDKEFGYKDRKPYHETTRRRHSYGDKERPFRGERSPRKEAQRFSNNLHYEERFGGSIDKPGRGDRPMRGMPHRSQMITPFRNKPRRDVQVTIKSDGIRAVNSNKYDDFVELQCPHCPDVIFVTFSEYKYHLESNSHKTKLDNLALKHSHVLRNIRLQQRTGLREMEDKWYEDNPEDFGTLATSYCEICKLAYKAPSESTKKLGTTLEKHNASKFHKMQKHYLNPQCTLCRMEFSSRMIYEYHICSIRHLKMQAQRAVEKETNDTSLPEEEKEELNLKDFITMDSVGDEEVGSEHSEITGRLEDVKAAEEEAKADEEEEENGEKTEEVPSEVEVEADDAEQEISEDKKDEEVKDDDGKPLGSSFIVPIEAVFCKLCNVAIRTDTNGVEAATKKHCQTSAHQDNYNYFNSEGSEGEGEGDDDYLGEEEAIFDDEDEHPFENEEEEQLTNDELEEAESSNVFRRRQKITRVIRNDQSEGADNEEREEEGIEESGKQGEADCIEVGSNEGSFQSKDDVDSEDVQGGMKEDLPMSESDDALTNT